MKIESITIKQEIDECPEVSWIGEFTSDYQDSDDIKRGSVFEHDKGNHRTHDFFVPTISVSEHRKGLQEIGYSKGEAERLARSYCRSDYERILALERGDFCFIGITAEACVSYPTGNNGDRRLEWLSSGGLWGIESDSGEYLNEIEQEQLSDLKNHLSEFGVDLTDFDSIEIEKTDNY